MDRFAAMTIFCQAVEQGSFAAAAERLNLSTSAVSRQIAQLEGLLHARLLNRTTRRISLTDDGRAYYERCLQLLSDLEETEELVGNARTTLRGTLRLTAPTSFGIWHLSYAIADFSREQPEVKFDVSLSDHQVDLVEAGLDLAIRVGTLGTQNLVARPIGKARLMTCASPGYLASHGVPQSPADLSKHQCLTYAHNNDSTLWMFLNRSGQPEEVRVKSALHADNGIMLRELAAQGMGVMRGPDFLLQSAVDQQQLQPIMQDWTPAPLTIYAAYPSRKHLSAKVRGFVSFLHAWLAARCPYAVVAAST
jgi:DNA-binding transcriptional LysR family regulator